MAKTTITSHRCVGGWGRCVSHCRAVGQLSGSVLSLMFPILLGPVGYPRLIFSLLEGESGRNSREGKTTLTLMAQAQNWHIVISAYMLLAKERSRGQTQSTGSVLHPAQGDSRCEEEPRANIKSATSSLCPVRAPPGRQRENKASGIIAAQCGFAPVTGVIWDRESSLS